MQSNRSVSRRKVAVLVGILSAVLFVSFAFFFVYVWDWVSQTNCEGGLIPPLLGGCQNLTAVFSSAFWADSVVPVLPLGLFVSAFLLYTELLKDSSKRYAGLLGDLLVAGCASFLIVSLFVTFTPQELSPPIAHYAGFPATVYYWNSNFPVPDGYTSRSIIYLSGFILDFLFWFTSSMVLIAIVSRRGRSRNLEVRKAQGFPEASLHSGCKEPSDRLLQVTPQFKSESSQVKYLLSFLGVAPFGRKAFDPDCFSGSSVAA